MMRKITLATCFMLAASHTGIEQELNDRVASKSVQKADLDSSTLGKSAALRNPATMNRLPTPMTSGRAGFGQLRAPVNQRTTGKVAAGLQDTAMADLYGQAIFDIGAKGGLDGMKDKMESLKVALDAAPELYGVLTSPLIAEPKKEETRRGYHRRRASHQLLL